MVPAALIPILSTIFERGGPALLQLIALANANGDANDVAELNRQIAVDEVAKASIDREIERVRALLNPMPTAPIEEGE